MRHLLPLLLPLALSACQGLGDLIRVFASP